MIALSGVTPKKRQLFRFAKWPARTLLGGNGFDDELALRFRVDGDFRAIERRSHQFEDFRIIEDARWHKAYAICGVYFARKRLSCCEGVSVRGMREMIALMRRC